MITMQDILHCVKMQNLSERCTTDTVQSYETFKKYTSSILVENRIKLANINEAFRGLSIYYIEYLEEDDEFVFHKKTFNKNIGEETVYVDVPPCTVKWIRTVGKEYVLMCNANDVIGAKLKYELPVIYKNS